MPGNPRDILDIQEAEELLKDAEAGFPSERSASMYREAIDILNAYAEEEKPTASVRQFIANLKYAYTRRVLTRLQEVPLQQVDVLFPYLVTFLVTSKEEFDALRLSHPEIGTSFDKCLERFRPQLEDIIRRMQHGKKS